MNSKFNVQQWAVASVAVFVVLSVFQYLVHGVLLSAWYQEHTTYWRSTEEMMNRMHWMYVGYALFAALFSFTYSRGYEGKPGIGEGLRYGMMVGALIGFPKMFADHTMFIYPGKMIVAWGISTFVVCVMLGILVGLVYKGGRQKTA